MHIRTFCILSYLKCVAYFIIPQSIAFAVVLSGIGISYMVWYSCYNMINVGKSHSPMV